MYRLQELSLLAFPSQYCTGAYLQAPCCPVSAGRAADLHTSSVHADLPVISPYCALPQLGVRIALHTRLPSKRPEVQTLARAEIWIEISAACSPLGAIE